MLDDSGLDINDITFLVDGLVISYMEHPQDVRVGGAVTQQHAIKLDFRHPDYREDILKLHDRAVRVLQNVLEDFHESEPYVPADDDDEEDEKGMGE